jgi:hypothetical protein
MMTLYGTVEHDEQGVYIQEWDTCTAFLPPEDVTVKPGDYVEFQIPDCGGFIEDMHDKVQSLKILPMN